MEFKREFLQALISDESDEAQLIKDEITETSRWSINYRAIFKY